MLFSFIVLLNIIQGNYQMESEKVENRYFCESRTRCFGRDAKSTESIVAGMLLQFSPHSDL